MTRDERKLHDAANDAYRKAWEVDGGKARERLLKATAALHADPLNSLAGQEYLNAVAQVESNKHIVDDLHQRRLQVFAVIHRTIQLEHYTSGSSTCFEKVVFVNGMKKFVPKDEVDRLRRDGLLRD